MDLDRRNFCLLLPAVGAACITQAAQASSLDCNRQEQLLLRFDHRADLAVLGAACVEDRPELRRLRAAAIYRTLARWVGIPSGQPADVFSALPTRIATDFEQGAVENLRGWQISHTEFLLAVLAASRVGAA